MRPPTGGVAGRCDMPTHQRLHVLGIAFEGDVVELDVRPLSELFNCQVRAGAYPGGAVAELAWIQVRHVPDTELFNQRVRAGAQAQAASPAHPSSDLLSNITLPKAVSPLQ